jgi:hypothetical protein
MGNDVKITGATNFSWGKEFKDIGKGTAIGAGVGGILGGVPGVVTGAIDGGLIGGIVGLFDGQGHGVKIDAGKSPVPEGAAIDTGDLKDRLSDNPGGQNALCEQMKAKVENLNKDFDDAKDAYKAALTKDPNMGPSERLAYESKIKQTQANFDQYKVNVQSVLGQLDQLGPRQDNVEARQRNVDDAQTVGGDVLAGAQKDLADAQAKLSVATDNIQATLNTPGPIVDQAQRFQASLNDDTLETSAQASSMLSQLNPQIATAQASEVDQCKAETLVADLGNNQQLLSRLQTALNMPGATPEELISAATQQAGGTAGTSSTDAIQNMVLQMLVNDRAQQTSTTQNFRLTNVSAA